MTALSSTLTTLENKQIPILLNPKKEKKKVDLKKKLENQIIGPDSSLGKVRKA